MSYPTISLGGPGSGTSTMVAATDPVVIGSVVLPFGPRKVTEHRQQVIATQQGMNAVFHWDYGPKPVQYSVEGYATVQDVSFGLGNNLRADIAIIRQVLAAFPDAATARPLLVPSLGIQDLVLLVDAQLTEDEQIGPGEPYYSLQFVQATLPGQDDQ